MKNNILIIIFLAIIFVGFYILLQQKTKENSKINIQKQEILEEGVTPTLPNYQIYDSGKG